MSFPVRAVQRCWHLVDASSQTVGRLANQVAPLLKGKHKPTYRPNADCGDYVVIINAEKVRRCPCCVVMPCERARGGVVGSSRAKSVFDFFLVCSALLTLSLLSRFCIGQIHWQQMEGQTLSLAHGLPRWFETTSCGRNVGTQTRRYFAQGHLGHGEQAQQFATWVCGTSIAHLYGTIASTCSAVTRSSGTVGSASS